MSAVQNALQHFRSLEGKLRFNFGTTSLIINPLTGVQILLNHLTMEARILAAAAAGLASIPPLPHISIGMPPGLSADIAKAAQIVQLGIAFIQGHEAQGMRYLFPPGGLITSWEVWTSIRLQIPVLTTTIGIFGVRTCACTLTATPPAPSMFEIPPGYTIIPPATPPLPR